MSTAKKRKAPGVEASAQPASTGLTSVQSDPAVKIQGFVYTDHWFTVPLDYDAPDRGRIRCCAREVVATNKVLSSNLPCLLFLQGGPGFQSPNPSESLSWLTEATKHFKVILLDQRGTGRSTPVEASSLQAVGDTGAQLAYLRCLRADCIVKDAEVLRNLIVPKTAEKKRWCILGQSFGGFCCVNYLSTAPEALLEVFITGGIPPLIQEPCCADAVYQATYKRLIVQNEKYYRRFPGDVQKVKDIVMHLAGTPEGGVQTPAGTWLRPRTLQLLGMSTLGAGGSGFERLHFLINSAMPGDGASAGLSATFLKAFDASLPFDANPLYAVLHEHCYTNGPAPRWSAARIRQEVYDELFDAQACAASADRPVYFTGEMVYPWMFDDIAGLRPFKEVAEAAAQADGWSNLYDAERLARNNIPVAAATYCEDMYVDFNLAQETAAGIKGIRQWMTNEFAHSGIRDDGARIFDRLLGMTRGTCMLF